MNTKKLFAALLIVVSLFTCGMAQQPLQFSVIPTPPFSPRAGDYLDNPAQFFQVIMTNTSSQTLEVYLVLKIDMLFPEVASVEVPPNRPPAFPLSVGPLQTLVLNKMHYDQLFGHLRMEDLITQNLITGNYYDGQMNLLPEGTYQICFTALNFHSPPGNPEVLSSEFGSCATFDICYAASAPEIISPSLCMIAMPDDILEPAQHLTVSWMPPAFSCGGVIANFLYALKIVEVMPGQDVQSAMDFNPSVLELNGLTAPSFMIDTMLFQNMFMRGERYAVQVTASDMNPAGHIMIANNGAGPICSFVWGSVPDPGVIVTVPPDEEEEEEEEVVPHTHFIAGTGCTTDPPQNTTPFQGTLSGKTVQVGNFLMEVVQANQAGSDWSGTGKVSWTPMNTPLSIMVSFDNIRVNQDLQVFDGKVLSLPQGALITHVPASIQHAMDYDEVMNEYTTLFNVDPPGPYRQKMEAFKEYLSAQVQAIQNLSGEVSLPVMVPTGIPGTDISIGIIGMVFTPTRAAMNAMTTFRLPEAKSGAGAEWLAFIGQGLCFEPNALVSVDEGRLFLATDVNIETIGGTEMQFKRANTLGNQSDGTFIEWDNTGFHQGQIAFDVLLHNDIIEEFPDGRPNLNSRARASFTTLFTDWNDWIATATVPAFQVRGLPGFSFDAGDIVYDHSSVQNPAGIVFPPDPSNDTSYGEGGTQWQGFYMNQLSVKLPPDFRPLNNGSNRAELVISQLIIDDFGVTFQITAQNVLQSGVLGGCAFSIETIQVDVFKSVFHGASIAGGIWLPIAEDPLSYQGVLRTGNDELDYAFSINPQNDLSMPMWVATLNIYQSSALEISKDDYGAAVSFLLHGDVSLISSQSSSNVPYKFFMPGIKFENLGLANRNRYTGVPEFYLSEGTWGLASDQKSLGPFNVNISVPDPYFQNGEFGLVIDSEFSIITGFTCSTSLNVAGQLNWEPLGLEPATASLKAVYLESISVEGQFGPVDISGTLDFYYNHSTYGDGIRGEVSATFDPLIDVQAVAQFGVKQQGNDKFTYWYVDASALFSSHIPLVTPLAMGGFSGGVYYNMKRGGSGATQLPVSEGTNIPALTDPSKSASGVSYTPQAGSYGFKAGITLVLQETPSAFNAFMEMELGFTDNSFDMLRFTGDAYVMSNFPANDSYLAKTNVEIEYDKSDSYLKFNARAHIDFLLSSIILPIDFEAYTDTKLWYLMMGNPHGERITATLINIKTGPLQAELTANCYMAFGNNLPNTDLPAPPQEVIEFLNLEQLSQHRASITDTDGGKGMLFGAGIYGNLEVSLLVYCHLTAIAGFDVSLSHYENVFCDDEPIGLHGWYGLGQVYGYFKGDVGLEIDVWFFKGKVSLVQLIAGAMLRGGMPTPFWAEGRARVSGSVLGGLIKFNGTVTLDVGKPCYPPIGDPLADIKILEEIEPGQESFARARQEEPVSIYAIPRATANLNLSDHIENPDELVIDLPPCSEHPNGHTRRYKFEISSVLLFEGISGNLSENASGGKPMEYNLGSYPHRNVVVIKNPTGGFREETNYAIRVEAIALQRYEGGIWEDPIINDVQQKRIETLDGYFRTGSKPDNIKDHVLASYPLHRQRFFPRDEDFWVVCNIPMRDIWQADTTRVEVYLTRLTQGGQSESDNQRLPSFSWHNYQDNIRITDPRSIRIMNPSTLLPNTMYRFSILRINKEKEIEYLARMSVENRRLIIRELVGNAVTNQMIQGANLSSGQVTMMSHSVSMQHHAQAGHHGGFDHFREMDHEMDMRMIDATTQDGAMTFPDVSFTERSSGGLNLIGRETAIPEVEATMIVDNYLRHGSIDDFTEGNSELFELGNLLSSLQGRDRHLPDDFVMPTIPQEPGMPKTEPGVIPQGDPGIPTIPIDPDTPPTGPGILPTGDPRDPSTPVVPVMPTSPGDIRPSVGVRNDLIKLFLDPSTQHDFLVSGSGSLRGITTGGGLGANLIHDTDVEGLKDNIFDRQPHPGPNINPPLGEVLSLMTRAEYDALYQADTIDLRAQALITESEEAPYFEIDYIDTMFTIVFSTSQYSSLVEKFQNYSNLIIHHPNEYAESLNAAEPFEVYDLIGIKSHILSRAESPYVHTNIPPLLKFYADYEPQHHRDEHWFARFNRQTHELHAWCGPPDLATTNWRPLSGANTVAHPRQLEVHFGNTNTKRQRFDFPVGIGVTGHEHYPGRHDWLVHHTGYDTHGPYLPGNLNLHEINNLKSPQPKTPQKLRYRHQLVRDIVINDLMAMQEFRRNYRELALSFQGTNSSDRKTRTNQWIEHGTMIRGRYPLQTQIDLPAYQLSYFYELAPNGSSPAFLEWSVGQVLTGPWPGGFKHLRIEQLNMGAIDYGSLDTDGWKYASPDDYFYIRVEDESPVLH